MLIATAFGVFPWELFWALVLGNYVFKVLVEIVFTPVTYKLVSFLKKAESEDYYDTHTNFNPFAATSK